MWTSRRSKSSAVILCCLFSNNQYKLPFVLASVNAYYGNYFRSKPFHLLLQLGVAITRCFTINFLLIFYTFLLSLLLLTTQENRVTCLWKMVPEYQSLSSVIFGMVRTSSLVTKRIFCRMAQGQFITNYGFFISQKLDGQVDQAKSLLVIQNVVSVEQVAIRKKKTQVRI